MTKIYFKKLGCKVNEYEASSVATTLKNNGYEIQDSPQNADFGVILTCAVTQEAEKKSRQATSALASANPNIKIIVCGCSSQNSPNDYLGKNNVIAVLGTANKGKILQIIQSNEAQEKMQLVPLTEKYDYYEIPHIEKTRHFVKIQDGCNNFCAYCLIPYIRGRSRSRSLEDCVKEIQIASKESKEVVLTGINVSDYKCSGGGLETLVDSIKNIDVRVRFSSLECNVITREFLQKLKQLCDFCPHFHLPLQSGCDKILKVMNRHYSTDEFLEKVALIREFFPYCGLTTDVIVGFPNETNEDFAQTLQTIKNAKFTDIHAFKYSSRKGTRLAKLKLLDAQIANERQNTLLALKKQLHTQFIQDSIGKIVSVLTENVKDGYFVGYSKEYLKVYIEKKSTSANQIVKVKVVEPFLDGVKGIIVD